MLDAFFVFTKGGLVLFSFLLAPLRGEPVEALIRTCLLEERRGEEAFTYAADSASYALKWAFHNEAALVFVAVRAARSRAALRCVAGAGGGGYKHLPHARARACARSAARCRVLFLIRGPKPSAPRAVRACCACCADALNARSRRCTSACWG